MWKPNREADCDCQLFSQNKLATPKHQYKLSEKQLQTPAATAKKQPHEKKSVKKILLSSSSKRNLAQTKDKSKQEPREKHKKQTKKKEEKQSVTPGKPQPHHIFKSNPRPQLQIQAPKAITIRVPVKTVKQVTLVKPVLTKQLVRSPEQLPNSDYFSGMQVQNSSSVSPKKTSNIHFSYTNKKIPESLEVTPETMTPDLIRQSSLNNIVRRDVDGPHLRRAESQNEICASLKTIREDTCKDSFMLRMPDKYEKAKSLKNLVQYQHFHQLQPKSTVSSGDKASVSDISGFSDVIETIQIRKHDKANHLSSDRLHPPEA